MAAEDIAHVRRGTPFTHAELLELCLRFERLDRDRSAGLSAEELLAIPEFAMNPLAPRVLEVLGLRDGGELDLVGFVRFLAVFHADADPRAKLDLAFRLYDLDDDGLIRPRELYHVVRLMAGGEMLLGAVELAAVVERTFAEAGVALERGDGASPQAGITRGDFERCLTGLLPSFDALSSLTVPFS